MKRENENMLWLVPCCKEKRDERQLKVFRNIAENRLGTSFDGPVHIEGGESIGKGEERFCLAASRGGVNGPGSEW